MAPARAGVVLLYHHVDTHTPAITSISPAQFVTHLDILEEEGFEILPLTELVKTSMESSSEDRKVAITFDDAYVSIFNTAYPELKRRGWPFTIFVATGLVSETSPLYLGWQQLKEMSDNGATIANHTVNHQHLIRALPNEDTRDWKARVLSEITEADAELRENGFDKKLFAYPYGEYNPAVLDLVEQLDFIGFGQQSGAIGPHSNLRLLPRFPLAGVYVGETAFRDKINSLAMPIVHPDINPIVTDDLHPPLELQFVDETVNITRLNCYGPGGLTEITRTGETTLVARATEAVTTGRSRYNCTLPKGNRFYWFSQLWIKKQDDGNWYPEP